MRTNRQGLQAFVILFFSITLALGIAGLFYYFKIKQNEKYQNQLHFRELKDVTAAIDNSLKQLNGIANQSQTRLKEAEAASVYLSELRRQYEQLQQSGSFEKLEKLAFEQKLEEDKLSDETQENDSDYRKINQLEQQIEAQYEELDSYEPQYESLMNEIFASFLSEENIGYFDKLDNCYRDDVQQVSEARNSYCVVTDIIDFFDVERFMDAREDRSQLDAGYRQAMPNYVSQLQLAIDEVRKKIAQLNASERAARAQRAAKEKTNTRAASSRSLLRSRQQTASASAPAPAKSAGDNLEPVISEQRAFLKWLEQSMSALLMQLQQESLREKWVDFVSNLFTLFSKIEDNVIALDELENATYAAQAVEQQDDQDSSQTNQAISEIEQKLLTIWKAQKAELEKIDGFRNRLDEGLTNLLEERKESNFLGVVKINVSRLGQAIDTKLSRYPKIKTSSQAFLQCLANYPLNSQFNACAESYKIFEDAVYENKIIPYSKLNESVENLVNQGKALRQAKFQPTAATNPTRSGQGVRFILDKDISRSANSLSTLRADLSAPFEIHVPFDDLIYIDPKRYPLILLVDERGDVVARKENVKVDAAQYGMLYQNIGPFLSKLGKSDDKNGGGGSTHNDIDINMQEAQSKGVDILKLSSYVDEEIANSHYRIFVTPYRHNMIFDKNGDPVQLYAIGFRNRAALTADKLAISNSLVVVCIILLALSLALLPLLRIRLISIRQGFTKAQRNISVIGLLSLFAILAIGLTHWAMYQQLKEAKQAQSEDIFSQLSEAFSDEIGSLSKLALNQTRDQGNHLMPPLVTKMDNVGINDYYIDFSSLDPSVDKQFYFLEEIFTLGQNATIQANDVMLRSSEKLKRTGSQDINIKFREYFKRANACDLWRADINDKCDQGIFIDRIFNIRDGRPSTQLSQALFSDADTPQDERRVIAYGVKLQSVMAPVLPNKFGFAIFENDTGKVLYHINDDRSLVENIYVETDNNGKLHAIVKSFDAQTLGKEANQSHYSFASTYRGKDHVFTAGALKVKVADKDIALPWTLVIFYEKDQLRKLSLLGIGVSLSAVLLLIGVTYAVVKLLSPPRLLRKLFWFAQPLSVARISETALGQLFDRHRYSLKIYACVLLFGLLCLLPYAYLHNKIIDKYAEYETRLANIAVDAAGDRYQAYRQSVMDYEWVTTDEEDQETKIPITVPCYGKGADQGLQGSFTCAKNAIKGDTDTGDTSYSLASLLFDMSGSGHSITDSFWLLGQQNKDNDGVLRWVLNFIYVLLLIALFYFTYMVVVREWLARRLMGSDVPANFRMSEKSCWKSAIYSKAILQYQHILFIRPTAANIKQFIQGNTEHPQFNLLTPEPMGIRELLNELSLPNLRAIRQVDIDRQFDNEMPNLIVITGLETVAMEKELRLNALELLEDLSSRPNLRVVLLCDVAPLYRLIQQQAYPNNISANEYASSPEIMRWSALIKMFVKVYDWIPQPRQAVDHDYDVLAVMVQEALGWPELGRIWEEFWCYHQQEKATDFVLEVPDSPAQLMAQSEDKIHELRQAISEHWNAEQIVEFFSANCGALYRYRWELCTKEERRILYQMALGAEPNPLNLEPLEHLMRRGYIFYDYGWHICNQSFARFIKTAEPQGRFAEWLREAEESNWKYAKIPIYAILISVVAIGAYAATDAVESMLSVLAGVFGLIPLAMRSLGAGKAAAESNNDG